MTGRFKEEFRNLGPVLPIVYFFHSDDNAQVETDFWDTLMKLDYSTSHKKKLNARLSQMYEGEFGS